MIRLCRHIKIETFFCSFVEDVNFLLYILFCIVNGLGELFWRIIMMRIHTKLKTTKAIERDENKFSLNRILCVFYFFKKNKNKTKKSIESFDVSSVAHHFQASTMPYFTSQLTNIRLTIWSEYLHFFLLCFIFSLCEIFSVVKWNREIEREK